MGICIEIQSKNPEDIEMEHRKEEIRGVPVNAEVAKSPPSGPRTGKCLATVQDNNGRDQWCVSTAAALFDNHPDWAGCLRFDKFFGKIMLYKPVPGTDEPGSALPREIADLDYTQAVIWCNQNGFPRASKEIVRDAFDAVADKNAIDPLVNMLGDLRWDGHERLSDWLTTYLGVEESEYARAIGRAWLIGAIARALRPGCKADNCLVLEGDQGIGKSTVLRILAGAEYFGDSIPDLKSKDASSYLRGKWIVELSELTALKGSSLETTKAFMSRQEERYRPAYGRNEIVEKRRCVFAGTTNADDYLRDPSGNRRFWPVRAGRIDLEALKRDRDQLLAEALCAFRNGETWWLSDKNAELAAIEQSERTEDDPWLAAIINYCEGKEAVSSKQILCEVLGFMENSIGRRETNRVTDQLRRLGYERKGQFTSSDLKGLARFVRKN